MTRNRKWLLDVFVPGRPAPQGSIRAITHRATGRAVAIKDNNQAQKTWRADIRDLVIDAWHEPPLTGGVQLEFEFVMPRPVSAPKTSTPPAIKRPDWDKLSRAVCDALTSAGVYRDDSQTIDAHVTKRIAERGEAAGCRIRLAEKKVINPQPVHGVKINVEVTTTRQIITIDREYDTPWTARADLQNLFVELAQLIGAKP